MELNEEIGEMLSFYTIFLNSLCYFVSITIKSLRNFQYEIVE